MANNNGNIIGAAHSAHSGVWDSQDQYQQALAGNWPVAVVDYWEPDNAATAPVGWWKAESHGSNVELWTSDLSSTQEEWTDSAASKPLRGAAIASNSGFNPVWNTSNDITVTSTEYGSTDYTPLKFSGGSGGASVLQKANTTNLAQDSSHVTVAMVVQKTTLPASTDVPVFLVGGQKNSSKTNDSSGDATMIACYINGSTDSIYFNDNSNSNVTNQVLSVNSNWTSNSTYQILIVRAQLSSGSSSLEVFSGGKNSSGTLQGLTVGGTTGSGSGSHVQLSATDDSHGFTLGRCKDIGGGTSTNIQMDGNSDVRFLESVVYSHQVTDADIQNLEGYFYHKFKGDTESPSLEANHPYLTSAPSV